MRKICTRVLKETRLIDLITFRDLYSVKQNIYEIGITAAIFELLLHTISLTERDKISNTRFNY